jgi:hypothetical protein
MKPIPRHEPALGTALPATRARRPARSLAMRLRRHAALCVLGVAMAGSAWAGRPLTVDDADVPEVGSGQLETWYARPAGRERVWTTSVGVGVLDWLELGGAVERDFAGPESTTSLQLKMRLTPVREGGCNFGALVGRSHLRRERGDATYLTGLFTCDLQGGPLHVNLGATRPDGGGTAKTWGVAKEFEFDAVTAHVEVFGQQHGKPTWQMGLRRELVKNVQLDGTLGRSERKTVFSVGLRLGF